jgi:hypothetical protein
MKLRLILEREWTHLFHGTFVDRIRDIKERGLDRGDLDRAHFSLNPHSAYRYEDPWLLVEVMVSKGHHELADPHAGRRGPRASSIIAKHGADDLLNNPSLAPDRQKYWAAASRHTQKHGIDKALEVNLPLPVTYTGNPRIVAMYIVKDGTIIDAPYWSRGASLGIGDAI